MYKFRSLLIISSLGVILSYTEKYFFFCTSLARPASDIILCYIQILITCFCFLILHFLIFIYFFILQFCVHKDKRKLLESLTSEINSNKNKTYIVNELLKSIATGKVFFYNIVRPCFHTYFLINFL